MKTYRKPIENLSKPIENLSKPKEKHIKTYRNQSLNHQSPHVKRGDLGGSRKPIEYL